MQKLFVPGGKGSHGEESQQLSRVISPSYGQNVTECLPRTTLVISHTNDALQCAIPSQLITGGNRVLKEYILERSSGRWFLKIRGKTIQPIQLGLDDNYNNLICVDGIVNSLKLCEGKDLVELNIQKMLKFLLMAGQVVCTMMRQKCKKILYSRW